MRFSTLVLLALEVLPSLALPQGDKATRSVGAKLAAAAPAGQVAIKALTAGDAKTTMQGGSEADTAIVTGAFGSLNIAVGGSKRQNIVLPANVRKTPSPYSNKLPMEYVADTFSGSLSPPALSKSSTTAPWATRSSSPPKWHPCPLRRAWSTWTL